jgi:hypothetical protein
MVDVPSWLRRPPRIWLSDVYLRSPTRRVRRERTETESNWALRAGWTGSGRVILALPKLQIQSPKMSAPRRSEDNVMQRLSDAGPGVTIRSQRGTRIVAANRIR